MVSLLVVTLIAVTVLGVFVIFVVELFRYIYAIRIERGRSVRLGGLPLKVLKSWPDSVRRKRVTESLLELAPMLRQDIVLYGPTGQVRKPVSRYQKPDRPLRVYLHAVPAPAEELGPLPVRIIDSCQSLEGFAPSGHGTVLYDDERNALAELVGSNELYILHSPRNLSPVEERAFLLLVLKQVVDLKSLGAAEYLLRREKVWEDMKMKSVREAALTICGRDLEEKQLKAEESRHGLVAVVQELSKQIETTCESITGSSLVAESFSEVACARKTHSEKSWERLRSLQQVSAVSLHENRLQVITEPLTCRDPRTDSVHLIGRFQIEIMLDGSEGGVRWYNLDNPLEDLQAPAVHASGIAFIGNTTALFPELIGKGEIEKVVKGAIKFIERVGAGDSAVANVSRFPLNQPVS